MNASDVRRAHELLDDLDARAELSQEQEKLLRSFLPERPKPKTLDDIYSKVSAAWATTAGNSWGQYETECSVSLEAWLGQLRNDLAEIIETEEALSPPARPALPAGMRLADHEQYGRCVVSPATNGNGECLIFVLTRVNKSGASWEYVEHGSLTFIDTEPAESAHPEFLETEKEYRSAPGHTVVAQQGDHPWVKLNDGTWITTGMDEMDEPSTDVGMSRFRRGVLRWGCGK